MELGSAIWVWLFSSGGDSRNELPPPTLDLGEITVTTAAGQVRSMSDQVTALAAKLGATARLGLPDEQHIDVLIDVPAAKVPELRQALRALPGAVVPDVPPNESPAKDAPPSTVIVHIVQKNPQG